MRPCSDSRRAAQPGLGLLGEMRVHTPTHAHTPLVSYTLDRGRPAMCLGKEPGWQGPVKGAQGARSPGSQTTFIVTFWFPRPESPGAQAEWGKQLSGSPAGRQGGTCPLAARPGLCQALGICTGGRVCGCRWSRQEWAILKL